MSRGNEYKMDLLDIWKAKGGFFNFNFLDAS